MKKTLNISIASRLFNIEEDAYHKLDSYLSSIKSYFHTSPDKTEIITDIEERIAEHFLESKTGIITITDVESLITTMGTVEQFAQSDKQDEKTEGKTGEKSANSETKSHRPKQLFRDPDDVIVAGVASGISHYFGIDPFILRIVFFASIFAGGTGIITYIILWLVVPEAKTASQKLAMYGDPVTLETLSEAAKERINSIPETSKNRVREWITLPFKIVGNVIRFILDLLPNAVRYFFGSILILGSIFVLIGTMLTSGFMFSGDILMFEGVTLQEFIPGILRHIITLGMALAIMIPAVCALVGGISLFKKKNILSSYVWLGLLGVWLIAISVSGYGIAKMTQRYDAVITNSPAYQIVTDVVPLNETFTKLEVQNGLDVKIVQGTTTEMKVQGRSASIDSVKTTVQNGTLVIERDRTYNNEQFCFFCAAGYRSVEITLTVARPLETVNVVHGSYVTGELTNSPILNLNIENGSNTEFTVRAQKLTINMIHGSSMTVRGSVMNADINLENGAYLAAKRLETTHTKIQAIHGSRADIGASQTLEAIARNGSRISYDGNPKITKTEENGSTITSTSISH